MVISVKLGKSSQFMVIVWLYVKLLKKTEAVKMDIEQAQKFLNECLQSRRRSLNNMETAIVNSALQGRQGETYREIAKRLAYKDKSINDKACDLWAILTEIFNEPVSKSNLMAVLERHYQPLDLPELWHLVWEKAAHTDKIYPEVVVPPPKIPVLGIWHPDSISGKTKKIRVGSRIKLKVSLQSPGYLVLLLENTEQEIYCLCPSFLASEPYLSTGEMVLPHNNPDYPSFEVQEPTGTEKIVALVTKEKPSLDWLPSGDKEPLQLDKPHLQGLLAYLQQDQNCQVMRTQYQVVA